MPPSFTAELRPPPNASPDAIRPAALPALAAWGWAILVLACAVLFFYQLGSYSLFDVDEPRYAQAAREMLESGDWITPTFNGALRFDKPVLFYWLIAGVYGILGVSEFSARLVSALTASGLVLATFGWVLFAWRQRGGHLRPAGALMAALMLATSVEVIALARMSITDMTLTLFLCLTQMTLFAVAIHDRRWWLLAGVFAGLAVLTKGPVGLVLPGAIFVIYSLVAQEFRQNLMNRWFVLALGIAAAIAVPWFLLAGQANGAVFWDAVFHHSFSRFTGGVAYHPQPAWFYVPVVAVGFLPWSLLLPVTLVYAVRRLIAKRMIPAMILPFPTKATSATLPVASVPTTTDRLQQRLLCYCLVWAIGVFGFYSLASTKLLTYILPMVVPMAILTAMLVQYLMRTVSPVSGIWRAVQGVAVLFGGLGLLVLGAAWGLTSGWLPEYVSLPPKLVMVFSTLNETPLNTLPVIILAIGFVFAAWALATRRVLGAVYGLVITMAAVAMVALNGLVPALNGLTQGAMQSFVQIAGEAPLVSYEITRPSLTFYAHRPIPHIAREDRAQLDRLYRQTLDDPAENTAPRLYIVTKNRLVEDFRSVAPVDAEAVVVSQSMVYSLIMLRPANTPTGGAF